MTTAYILIDTIRGKEDRVARAARTVSNVIKAKRVYGRFNVLVELDGQPQDFKKQMMQKEEIAFVKDFLTLRASKIG